MQGHNGETIITGATLGLVNEVVIWSVKWDIATGTDVEKRKAKATIVQGNNVEMLIMKSIIVQGGNVAA